MNKLVFGPSMVAAAVAQVLESEQAPRPRGALGAGRRALRRHQGATEWNPTVSTGGPSIVNKTPTLVPIVATVALLLAGGVACGTGGSNGAGIAGSTGTGGGGGARVVGCTASNTSTAPADGLIADFTNADGGPDAGAIEIMGGILAYNVGTIGSQGSPNYTTIGGTLNITEDAMATLVAQYAGVLIYFDNCIDASAFTGVQFTIAGSFSGCTLQYLTTDTEHDDVTYPSPNPHASGAAGAYAPYAQLSASQVTPTPTLISMPFNGAGAPSGGNPDGVALDASKLDRIDWQLAIPAASVGGATCMASLSIDDVKFYH
jgi:hypothetical protein